MTYNTAVNSSMKTIGTLGESHLHAALKAMYAQPGDVLEADYNGYIIDILRGQQLIEIQTRSLGSLRPKLTALLPQHPILLVHPLPKLKWIQRQPATNPLPPRRKSPKQARLEDAFRELLHIADLLPHPNLTIGLAFIEIEEVWREDGQGSWRRKGWSITERRFLSLHSERHLNGLADYAALLPATLPEQFTNAQLSSHLRIPGSLAGKMTWTLTRAGVTRQVGRAGRAHLFERLL